MLEADNTPEALAVIFDKPRIDDVGVEFVRLFKVVEELRLLCEFCLKRNQASAVMAGSFPTISQMFDLSLRADPVRGSLKVPLWAQVSAAALGLLGNASQVTGLTLQDALTAIQDRQGESKPTTSPYGDPDRALEERVARLLSAAAQSGCPYVAIERGNTLVILHGGTSARLSQIGGRPQAAAGGYSAISRIYGPVESSVEVFLEGRAYSAFLVDSAGAPQTPVQSGVVTPPAAVLVWGSKRPFPDEAGFLIETRTLDPTRISHAPDIPEEYHLAPVVYFVTGATPVAYE